MKISVSLKEDELATLDRFVKESGLPSRSAGLQHAIRLLNGPKLELAYATAWNEWSASEDDELWEQTTTDGLPSAAR
ncbi:ribbon-helix-helix protein, CopG family [Leucobacter viscericola]|uniref:Ribbon-helix-helix protein, CopG family n=1 Tax=Leucobacter viscericola TaxID=2714935 RepID=A0A6G7XI21_9MICO|nr:ribbon-helix-helix domain-containing protein [Leucobacter viscericola]QIK64027.1 ribbon-helix-helix protein, CopG family [Leucobacter viscericola]